MTEIGKINREAAKLDPAAHYGDPHEVASEPMLTRGEKIATLERWRHQLLEQMGASDDGMPTFRTSQKSIDLIAAIDDTLKNLKAADPDSR